jgi:hypothetical protein
MECANGVTEKMTLMSLAKKNRDIVFREILNSVEKSNVKAQSSNGIQSPNDKIYRKQKGLTLSHFEH